MALSVKCLVSMRTRLLPQKPHRKAGHVADVLILVREVETGIYLGLAGQPAMPSLCAPGPSKAFVSKHKVTFAV